uniref:AB hydrolase-1 domain-containing protein n=1 Tax=Meloidogyne hapla TaxID=6305 RepID=A0A1I8BJN6_MELHA
MNNKNINILNKLSSTYPTPFTQTNEDYLFQLPFTLNTVKGKVTINAVYQDTHPDGSSHKGRTVIMLHGAPGSHKDFKYIVPLLRLKGVRSIAINWPGLGYSEYDDNLQNNNFERTEFVQAIINLLKLQKPLIFFGHSRGAENAFRLAEKNEEKTIGIVAANFVGIVPHTGVRPFFAIKFFSALWDYAGWVKLQKLLEPLYKAIYKYVGFKTSDGYIAARCLKTMASTDFDIQLTYLFPLIMNKKIRILFAYSGNDHLVEPEKSEELLDNIGLKEECRLVTSTIGDEPKIIESTRKLMRKGHKHVAVYFADEGHFLQKFRCKFLADSIIEMFEEAENNSKL